MPLLPLYCCRRSYLERHRPLAKYSGAGAGQQQQLPERVARYTAQGEWVPVGLSHVGSWQGPGQRSVYLPGLQT